MTSGNESNPGDGYSSPNEGSHVLPDSEVYNKNIIVIRKRIPLNWNIKIA